MRRRASVQLFQASLVRFDSSQLDAGRQGVTMNRSRFRVLAVLSSLLLIFPLLAGISTPAVVAQDGTPTAQTAATATLAEAMPATVQAYVATKFDPASDQYVDAIGLASRIIIPGAGDTISALVERLAGLIDVIPADTRDVLIGDVGIGIQGFEPPELGGELDTSSFIQSVPPAYAGVLHPEKAGDARKIVEDWYTKQLAENGLEPQRTETGSTVILRNPDPSTASFPTSPAVVMFVGDYILMGETVEQLQPFAETIQGNRPSLADSDDLDRLVAELPAEQLLFGYVGGETLTESAAGIFNASTLADSIDPPFGTTAFAVTADDPGLRFESVSQPVVGSTLRQGLNAENPDFASQLPDSTLAMFAGSDLGESWLIAQIQKVLLSVLMSSLGGGDIDLTDSDIGAQFGVLAMLTGINFKTDLMDQLSGSYGAALFSIDTENPLESSAVVASDLGDNDRVSVGVTSLGPLLQSAAAGSVSITTSSVADQTVNNVTVYSDNQTATIQYGVVNDQLIVGLGDGVSTLAAPPTSPLADDLEYQAALAELPSSYSSMLYVDVQEIARQLAPYLIETLASGSGNSIAQCLVENTSTGTPEPSTSSLDGTAGAICSLIDTIFGDNALPDFLVSRMPGPLTAVAYQADGLQHISGILVVGTDQ